MVKKIAILADVTFDLIIKSLRKNDGLEITNYFFDNIISTLLSQRDILAKNDFVFIHSDTFFHHADGEELQELYENIASFADQFAGTLIVSNSLSAFPNTNLKQSFSTDTDLFFESKIELLMTKSNIFIFDFQKIIQEIGFTSSYHFKLGHLYQMPYTKPVLERIGMEVEKFIHFLSEEEKKVIVLDCDNTLWGGILGEDGLENLQINKNSKGIVYLHFQKFIKQKMKEGFLLAICSKNNENEVKEALEKLKMPLEWNDFVIKSINWESKVENLKKIGTSLNLGLSSFIFIDDSDFEINAVRELLPEITCWQMNDKYEDFLNLKNQYFFKKKRILKEDLLKNDAYKIEAERQVFQSQTTDFEAYIKNLNIQIEIFTNEKNHFERYAQMTEKTNQFNFNKEIFSEKELEIFIENGNLIFGISVADRFGDYGIVGLILAEVQQNGVIIRNYLMSCRALGRNIEFDFWKKIIQKLEDKNLKIKEVRFVNSEKNKPAQDFFEKIK
jgi:FkbH-like protein